MKNEETSRETPRDNAKVRMKKACHSAIGRSLAELPGRPESGSLAELGQAGTGGQAVSFRKHSSFCIPWPSSGRLHSSFSRAFTLLEVMIAVALFGLVMAGTIEVYIMCNKLWHATSLSMQTVRESSLALSRLVYGMETNNGLRAAATITLNTNVHGHWDGVKYWETGGKPLPVSSASQYLCGWSSLADGSWRLCYSNAFGGVKYIDYNFQERSLLFLPASNAIASRLLICNYVKSATVTTNLSGTIGISLTVEKRDGNFVSSNTVNTLVKIRNKS